MILAMLDNYKRSVTCKTNPNIPVIYSATSQKAISQDAKIPSHEEL